MKNRRKIYGSVVRVVLLSAATVVAIDAVVLVGLRRLLPNHGPHINRGQSAKIGTLGNFLCGGKNGVAF